TAIVAGTAPAARTACSIASAVSAFAGHGSPSVISVDSRATIGRFWRTASSTSGAHCSSVCTTTLYKKSVIWRGRDMARRECATFITRTIREWALAILAATAVLLAACGNPPTAPIIPPGPYTPGQSYFGRNNYIEYIAGNSPLILSAAHGGNV